MAVSGARHASLPFRLLTWPRLASFRSPPAGSPGAISHTPDPAAGMLPLVVVSNVSNKSGESTWGLLRGPFDAVDHVQPSPPSTWDPAIPAPASTMGHFTGADPGGGGVLGVRTIPPPPFGGPPNFIKRDKMARVTPRFSILNSYPDPPPLSEILYPPLLQAPVHLYTQSCPRFTASHLPAKTHNNQQSQITISYSPLVVQGRGIKGVKHDTNIGGNEGIRAAT